MGPGQALGGPSSLAISLPHQVASQDRKNLLALLPKVNTGHPRPVAASFRSARYSIGTTPFQTQVSRMSG